MDVTAKSTLQMTRVFIGGLTAGVAGMFMVSLLLTEGGREGTSPEALSPELAFWIWLVAAIAGLVGAAIFRSRALKATEDLTRGGDSAVEALGVLHANLIFATAIIEAPALLGGVFFLLIASKQLLWAASAVYLVGLALIFPRAEWYGIVPGRVRNL